MNDKRLKMTTICLNMIVKNEAHVIENTLANLLDYFPITYWVISDTGSTDGTPQVIENFFKDHGIDGEMVYHDWSDFGTNRQLALEAATGKADYALVFDADDRMEGEFPMPDFTVAGYYLKMREESGSTQYVRPLLFKNDGSFFWRGVLHEFLVDKENRDFVTINGDYFAVSCRNGGRSFDPDKYKNDALVLEKAIDEDKDPDLLDRYLFYAGQSWMAAGEAEKGAYWYEKRAERAGWNQELAVAEYRLGEYYQSQNDEAKAIYHWLKSAEAAPERAEAWYQLSRINSWANRHQVAYPFAHQAAMAVSNKPEETTFLFEDASIYQLWAHYECFMNAFYAGHYEESYESLKIVIFADTRHDLYENELEKLRQLSSYAQKDTYAEVTRLRHFLVTRGAESVLEALGLT